jgi:hypothetical protein
MQDIEIHNPEANPDSDTETDFAEGIILPKFVNKANKNGDGAKKQT